MTKAAIAAQVVDIQNDRQHKGFIKVTVHVPAEQGKLLADALGWPTYTDPVPVALARLNSASNSAALGDAADRAQHTVASPPKHRKWSDIPPDERAGIRCNDPLFQKFLNEEFPGHRPSMSAAEWVRDYCQVDSRAELRSNAKAANCWNLLDSAFIAWNEGPKHGA